MNACMFTKTRYLSSCINIHTPKTTVLIIVLIVNKVVVHVSMVTTGSKNWEEKKTEKLRKKTFKSIYFTVVHVELDSEKVAKSEQWIFM